MSKRKKRKTGAEIALAALGRTLLEISHEENQQTEALEQYSHLIKSKIHFREEDFCERFVHGFNLLREDLNQ